MGNDYNLYLNEIGVNEEEKTIIADYIKELFTIAMISNNLINFTENDKVQ